MAVSKVILNGETLIDVTQKTVTPSNMLSGITALKNDGTDITGSIAAKSAADLITSGSQVTVPSGMYAAAATTAVASGSVKFFDSDLNLTPVFTLDTATGVVSASSQKGIESIPLVTPGYVSNADSHFVMGSASGSYQLPIHGNLTASGSIVTAPSGWYGTAASTAVEAGWISLALGSTKISIDSGRFNIDDQTGIIYVNDGVTLTQVPPFIPGYISDVGHLELDVEASGSYQLPVKTASDLQAAGSVVTVPSGYYTTDVSKAVASGSINLNLYSQIDLDSYSFNINPDTGVVYVDGGVISTGRPGFSSGYISDPGYYMIEASASGSYALPTHSSADLTASGSVVTVPSGWYGTTASKAIASGTLNGFISVPSILPNWSFNNSAGTINARYEMAPGIQPIASSGYFKTDEYIYPMITMDSSYQLPVKAAATIIPSTADQVVASGYFLTGAQTVKGDSALIPSNIAAGVSIFGIEGTHQGGGNLQDNKTVNPSETQQIIQPDMISEAYISVPNGTTTTAPSSNEVFTVTNSPVDGKSYYFNGILHGEDNTIISIDGTITASSGGCNFTNILTITGSSSVFYAYWSNGTIEFVTNAGHLTTDGNFNIYEAPLEYYDGLAQVTVNAAALQSKVVTPSTEQQIITPDNRLYGIIPQGTVSEEPYPGWPALPGVYPPSPISVGTHVEGLIDIVYNTNKIGTIEINGDITESHFESICTLTAAPAYQSTLQLGNAVWDSDGLNFYLSLGGLSLVAATDIRFDSLPVYNYYGLSQVTVEAVAATTSYYLAQDSQGYITYSSIMPSGGEYYIFDVAGIKHIEGN